MSMTPPGARCAGRMYEWIMASTMISIGIGLALPGNSLAAGAFRHLHVTEVNENVVAVVIGAIGVLRVVALFLNGRWKPYGAYCRTAAAVVGALTWSLLASTLLFNSLLEGVLSIGFPIYVNLLIGELVSARRSSADAYVR